jgi:hypothetical protein
VRGARPAPQTTVAANFQPLASPAYEKPIQRRWPIWIAFTCLFALLFVGIGMLAALLIQQSEASPLIYPTIKG